MVDSFSIPHDNSTIRPDQNHQPMKRFLRLPPVIPALCTIIAGVVHNTIWAFEPLQEPWNNISGGIIIAIAILMFTVSILAFRRRGESFNVGKPTANLITDGIYATSRNPAYLAMLIAIFGIGCAANSLAIILATIPSFVAFNWFTIPREERYLLGKLGFAYDQYRNRVRRWL